MRGIINRITIAARLAAIGVSITLPTFAIAGDAPKPPEWQVNEAVVPLTGAKSINAVLVSTNSISNMIGNPDHAALMLRCSDNVLAAYVAWPQVLQTSASTFGGTPQTMVLWKLDQAQIDVNFWDKSDSGIAAGKFDTKGAMKLVGRLIPAHRLVVRLTGSTTEDAIFDLGDIAGIAARVGSACNVTWKAPK